MNDYELIRDVVAIEFFITICKESNIPYKHHLEPLKNYDGDNQYLLDLKARVGF